MRSIFIINPAAGKKLLQEGIKNSIEEYFKQNGGEYKIYFTTRAGEGREIAEREAVSGEKTRFFACGGEGTVLEVLNGIAGGENATLGVLPCGSANDFLKYFGNDKKELFLDIEAQMKGEEIPVDIIKANDTYCLNSASVGMDAMVARDMILFKNWPLVSGPAAYKLAIVKTFLSKLGVKIMISVDDGEPKEQNCLFAVIANAPYYGGGYISAPKADPFDKRLDFTLVDTIGRLQIPKFLSLYSKGEHGILDYCHLKTCEKMTFTSEKPIPVNLDGEIVETTEMTFSLVSGALRFIVPEGVNAKLKEKEKITL